MAYDAALAARIRQLLTSTRAVREKPMFGGLAFLVRGNMSVAVSSKSGILVRVDPEGSARLTQRAHVRPMVMRGRPMKGWLRVADDGLRTRRQLAGWVQRGVAYAQSLPAKP